MASFHKYITSTGDTRWRVAYRKSDRSQGSKRGFPTKRQAQAWWNTNAVSLTSVADTPTVAEMWSEVMADAGQQWAGSTRVNRERTWKEIAPRWGRVPVGDITTREVKKWLDQDISPLFDSDVTVKQYLVVLRHCTRRAHELGYIPADPVAPVRARATGGDTAPRKRKRSTLKAGEDAGEIVVLTDAQVQLIIDQIKQPVHKAAVQILAATGLRFGECAALRAMDIDLDAGVIWVRRTVSCVGGGEPDFRKPKSGRVRAVTIPGSLRPLLSELVAAAESQEDVLLKPPRRGEYLPTPGSGRWLGTAVERARKIDPTLPAHITPHVFRHTAVSRWIDAGVPITAISRQVGHSNPSITLNVYSHIMPDVASYFTGL